MIRRTHWTFLATSLAVLSLGGCGTADKAATTVQSAAEAQTSRTLSTTDATFINEAAASGLAEAQFGQLAARKGAARSVRRFGQQMAAEHAKLNQEIRQLARNKGLSPATTLDAESRQAYDMLRGLSGRAFDRAYLQETLTGHQEQLALFQREVQDATDPEVKAFAARYIGVLQHHLDEAERLNNVVPRRYRAQAT